MKGHTGKVISLLLWLTLYSKRCTNEQKMSDTGITACGTGVQRSLESRWQGNLCTGSSRTARDYELFLTLFSVLKPSLTHRCWQPALEMSRSDCGSTETRSSAWLWAMIATALEYSKVLNIIRVTSGVFVLPLLTLPYRHPGHRFAIFSVAWSLDGLR